ncbi:MAG: hypothetical protein IPJ50_19370 [Betaproteobacteria bacterium]|nr:hypothetical protein [Betaproteobacteria bacterium]
MKWRTLLHLFLGNTCVLLCASVFAKPPSPPIARQAELQMLQTQIQRLPAADAAKHTHLKELASKVLAADGDLARQAEHLSPRERAVAEAQIDVAIAQLKAAATEPSGSHSIALAMAAQAVEVAGNSARQAPGAARRQVVVVVKPTNPSGQAAPLDVYALPLGVLLHAHLLRDTHLLQLIEALRFKQLTSPSVDQLESGGTYALWVASPNQVTAMTALVHSRTRFAYRTIKADTEPGTIEFSEASQVRLPAAAVSVAPRRQR